MSNLTITKDNSNCDLHFGRETDDSDELCVEIINIPESNNLGYTYINKDDAQAIVHHLVMAFGLEWYE